MLLFEFKLRQALEFKDGESWQIPAGTFAMEEFNPFSLHGSLTGNVETIQDLPSDLDRSGGCFRVTNLQGMRHVETGGGINASGEQL